MKKWNVKYGINDITVVNKMNGEYLYVNGELQDEMMGLASRSRLWGRLDTGETIKVSLGGDIKIHCRIFINDKLVLSD